MPRVLGDAGLLGQLCNTFWLTWLFAHTRSVLLRMLFHAATNTANMLFVLLPVKLMAGIAYPARCHGLDRDAAGKRGRARDCYARTAGLRALSSDQTCRSLPPRAFGRGASELCSIAMSTSPRSARYCRNCASAADQTIAASAWGSVSSRSESARGPVWISWKRLRPGVSSTTVSSASGSNLTCVPSAACTLRISSVRPSTRKCGNGLPHAHRPGIIMTLSPNLVANNRLNVVGQVRHRERVRGRAERNRSLMIVDPLKDEPISAVVHCAITAHERAAIHFCRVVEVDNRAGERGFDLLTGREGECFTGAAQECRLDMPPVPEPAEGARWGKRSR